MAAFPLYVDLTGKKCIVIGGGNIAARKIKILLEFEAEVLVISPEINSYITDVEKKNKLKVKKKLYSEEDLNDAFIVIAATSDEEVNEKIYNHALKRNIPVNVVDDPQKCTFIFPAIVKRNELVIGISTSGTYPALSKGIRKKIEDIVPEEYCDIIKILAAFREKIQAKEQSPMKRKTILNKVVKDIFSYEGCISVSQVNEILDYYLKNEVCEEN